MFLPVPQDFEGPRYRSKWSIKAHWWRVFALYTAPFFVVPILAVTLIQERSLVLLLLVIALAGVLCVGLAIFQMTRYDNKQVIFRIHLDIDYKMPREHQEALDWAKEYDSRQEKHNALYKDPLEG